MRDPSVLDAEIRTYLEAENAYTEAALDDTHALQQTLYAEMKARIKEDDSSVPAPDGPFDYFMSYVTGGQYPRLCRRPRGGGPEEILLDGNAEAAGKPYWQLGATAHSPDHKLLAYAVDDKGSELLTIRIRDLATGQDLADVITDMRSSIVWSADSRFLFYVRLDANQRPLFVYRHRVGTPGSEDVLVYEEKDIGFYVGVGQTQSSRYITIDAHDHQTTEVYLIDADHARSGAAPGGAARARPRVLGRASRRAADHHHQLGRRRGLPHLRGPARRARHGQLARDHPAQAGTADHRDARLQGPSRAAGARGRPAAHHPAPLRRRRRARHRLRGGGLCARHVGRLRVRHHHAALHLLLDDHAGAGVRLRHGASARACCARRRRSRAATTRTTTSRAACWRPPPTARRCRSRCSTGRARRSTARRRCSCTATAPTASRSRPASRPRGCRWSTAASCSPSPICAAARRRATAGTPTAS